MADLRHMSRILYDHQWTNPDDWAQNVVALADLNDDEIQQLEHCAGTRPQGGRRRGAASPAPRRTLGAAGFLEAVRVTLRRAF